MYADSMARKKRAVYSEPRRTGPVFSLKLRGDVLWNHSCSRLCALDVCGEIVGKAGKFILK